MSKNLFLYCLFSLNYPFGEMYNFCFELSDGIFVSEVKILRLGLFYCARSEGTLVRQFIFFCVSASFPLVAQTDDCCYLVVKMEAVSSFKWF